jgi:hypothetical protein
MVDLMSLEPSVPIPKFAHTRGGLRCELWNQRDTSKYMLVCEPVVVRLTSRQCEPDRQAIGIDQRMNLAVQPAP